MGLTAGQSPQQQIDRWQLTMENEQDTCFAEIRFLSLCIKTRILKWELSDSSALTHPGVSSPERKLEQLNIPNMNPATVNWGCEPPENKKTQRDAQTHCCSVQSSVPVLSRRNKLCPVVGGIHSKSWFHLLHSTLEQKLFHQQVVVAVTHVQIFYDVTFKGRKLFFLRYSSRN